jgi:hypothetical protein
MICRSVLGVETAVYEMWIQWNFEQYIFHSIQSLSWCNFISNPNFLRKSFVINRNLHKMEISDRISIINLLIITAFISLEGDI